VVHDLVRDTEFFKEPTNPMRAGIVQVVLADLAASGDIGRKAAGA